MEYFTLNVIVIPCWSSTLCNDQSQTSVTVLSVYQNTLGCVYRTLSRMQSCHQLQFPGQSPVVRKGQVEPIDITVASRGSNKKVWVRLINSFIHVQQLMTGPSSHMLLFFCFWIIDLFIVLLQSLFQLFEKSSGEIQNDLFICFASIIFEIVDCDGILILTVTPG